MSRWRQYGAGRKGTAGEKDEHSIRRLCPVTQSDLNGRRHIIESSPKYKKHSIENTHGQPLVLLQASVAARRPSPRPLCSTFNEVEVRRRIAGQHEGASVFKLTVSQSQYGGYGDRRAEGESPTVPEPMDASSSKVWSYHVRAMRRVRSDSAESAVSQILWANKTL